MATYTESSRHDSANGNADFDRWRQSTRVVLSPIAAPSILGLFGFAASTFMVAAHIAGWYGNANSPVYLFPFAAIFGGVAQFAAGMWAYRARDAVATAVHGMWGSFWIAYGILFLLVAAGDITVPSGTFSELAFWFFPLAAITAVAAIASARENLGVTATLITLAVGAGLLAVGYLVGGSGWLHTGGWVLIASSICAFYTASAMMLKASFGRVLLPVGETRAEANVPGRVITHPIQYSAGEPGVKQGQ
ncbi:MAG TPA: acetate uptake transporter [Solirubrobacteraceae bacterium]|nr:acetate uptake transporter [Solirubrobacteraceae bacterium]